MALAVLLSAVPAAGETGQVVLRLKDSEVEIAGALKRVDGATYVLEAPAFGVLSLDAARYDCEGAPCKAAAASIAAVAASAATVDFVTAGEGPQAERFIVAGSDTVGRELMPALIRDYARSLGGSVRQLVGSKPDEQQFRVLDAAGRVTSLIDVAAVDPSTAFRALGEGRAAIAMSSRPASVDEAAFLPELRADPVKGAAPEIERVVALDGITAVVHPQNAVASISIGQLADIVSGKIRNWSELGQPAAPISLYLTRDDASAHRALKDLVLVPEKLTATATAVRLASEAELSDAVATDVNAIGITSYAMLRNAKALKVTGSCGLEWQPNEFSIKSEEYPLSRRLLLYSRPKAAPVASGLVAFATSPAAQSIVAASAFMDQTVVSETFAEHGGRITRWIETAPAEPIEKGMARRLLGEVKDARRLSLTYRFALGSSRLDAKARGDIVRLAELLQTPEYKSKTVLLYGFTDGIGTPQTNAALARRRADEVRSALLAQAPAGRIDPSRLMIDGFAAIAPVACNDGAEAMIKNRRVEVWVRDRAPAIVQTATPAPTPRRRRR